MFYFGAGEEVEVEVFGEETKLLSQLLCLSAFPALFFEEESEEAEERGFCSGGSQRAEKGEKKLSSFFFLASLPEPPHTSFLSSFLSSPPRAQL